MLSLIVIILPFLPHSQVNRLSFLCPKNVYHSLFLHSRNIGLLLCHNYIPHISFFCQHTNSFYHQANLQSLFHRSANKLDSKYAVPLQDYPNILNESNASISIHISSIVIVIIFHHLHQRRATNKLHIFLLSNLFFRVRIL